MTMCDPFSHDEYEYRIGYQYKDARVSHVRVDEREMLGRLEFWRTHNRFLLMSDPWLERRRVLPWERWSPK
jgi:hypothetical protein